VSNPRPTGDRLLELLTSGELHQTARTCRTRGELARAIGMTDVAYEKARARLVVTGHAFPGFNDLRAGIIAEPDIATPVPSWEEVTKPHVAPVVGKWPNVEAFDAGEERPPLPAIGKGFRVRKVSTLVDAVTGESKLQWIKTASAAADVDPVEVLRLAFGEAMPRMDRVEPPIASNEDLLAVYGMGDPHIGMLAWEAESGENFDLAIAERDLVTAADQLVSLAPPARTALVLTVGDTLHSDGQRNATTKGTPVDVDGRTPKMVATAIRTFRRVIERSLEKHEDVHVKIARGNHDEMMSVVLAIALGQYYENNPRVHVDVSPTFFHWFRFHNNLIGITHGNRQKPIDIMGVMASTQARDWGETEHRRVYCGHYHHEMTKEVPGMTVDYLPTLAAKEAYAAAHGYIAGRSMRMDVIHKQLGLINRHIVGISQIREFAA
jgi:hypothetical protein